jgi:hypothetical protein
VAHRGGAGGNRLEETLSELCGHEKKFKNDQIRKIGINEINDLQVLILAKIDFFSRPASLW